MWDNPDCRLWQQGNLFILLWLYILTLVAAADSHHNGKTSSQERQPAVDAQCFGSFLQEGEYPRDKHLQDEKSIQSSTMLCLHHCSCWLSVDIEKGGWARLVFIMANELVSLGFRITVRRFKLAQTSVDASSNHQQADRYCVSEVAEWITRLTL